MSDHSFSGKCRTNKPLVIAFYQGKRRPGEQSRRFQPSAPTWAEVPPGVEVSAPTLRSKGGFWGRLRFQYNKKAGV
jgi:hypothetical protein